MQIGSSTQGVTAQDLQSQLFASADTNGDNSLSLDEFLTMMKNATASAAVDSATATDPNATATTAATDAFKAFDTNGDGKLSQAELTSGLDSVAKKFADAISQYVGSGNGSSLIDLMFGTPTASDSSSSTTNANGATTAVSGTASATTTALPHSATSNDGDADDATGSGSGSTDSTAAIQKQRELQWYASAFSSQYNVNQQLAVAA